MGRRPFLAATGLLAGLLSGLLGVGGGVLMVPALRSYRVGASWPEAAGTSLAAIIPIVAAGMVTYAAAGSVDGVAAVGLLPAAVLGAVAGAHLGDRVPGRATAVVFALVTLAVAVRLAVPTGLPSGGHSVAGPAAVIALVVIGLVSGGLSGMLGIGGGVVMVPALVLALDLPQQPAQGTSLAAALPTAAGGAITHLRLGHVDLAAAAALGVPGVAGAVAGAVVAVHVPQLPLRLAFAAWLIAVSVHTLRQPGAGGRPAEPGR